MERSSNGFWMGVAWLSTSGLWPCTESTSFPCRAQAKSIARRCVNMLARCDDIDVSWFQAGRGNPLILVHGLADDHRAWRRALPDLMLRHRVLMYDLRGHGETTLGKPDGTLSQLGLDLVALLDAIRVQRAVIAGVSLGGTIAMRASV